MHRLAALVALFTVALAAPPQASAEDALAPLVDALAASDRDAQAQAARELAATGDARVGRVLDALVSGQLYARRDDGRVVVGRREGRGYALTDPLTGADLGNAGRRDVSRIAVTGAQRDAVRELIVTLQLGAEDVAARRSALDALMAEPAAIPAAAVASRLAVETDAVARRRLEVLSLLAQLEGAQGAARIDIVAALGGYSHPAVRARLQSLVDDDAGARSVRDAASRALARIDRRQSVNRGVQTLFFGVSFGSVLVLAALGLAITFGVMGVINMAHGELIMLGAYTTWAVQALMPDSVGLALVLAVPAAFAVSGAVGILIERIVVRQLYDRPLETLLATFGVSLILQQGVRSLFGPLNRSVTAPDWMSGSLEFAGGLTLTVNRIVILVFCLAVFAAVQLVMRRTRFGLQLRAVAQNRRMARVLGVRAGRIDALTFGLGSGVAGVAGVALSQLTNVGPNLGQAYIVDSFLVVVVGGVGNLWGTLVAGLSIGLGNQLLEPATGAVLAKILLLVAIILFIQKRPRGLFPQRGRAADG